MHGINHTITCFVASVSTTFRLDKISQAIPILICLWILAYLLNFITTQQKSSFFSQHYNGDDGHQRRSAPFFAASIHGARPLDSHGRHSEASGEARRRDFNSSHPRKRQESQESGGSCDCLRIHHSHLPSQPSLHSSGAAPRLREFGLVIFDEGCVQFLHCNRHATGAGSRLAPSAPPHLFHS